MGGGQGTLPGALSYDSARDANETLVLFPVAVGGCLPRMSNPWGVRQNGEAILRDA